MSELFEEWPLDDDGFPHRQAARIVLFAPSGETFMLLGHDLDDLEHRWWFTPGGGLEGDESPAQGAVRELAEETGLHIDASRLIGPVLYRQSTFYFATKTRKQDEHFFVAHVTEKERAFIDDAGQANFTELEKNVIDAHRWWDLDELETIEHGGEKVFPLGFVERARRWRDGWDGECESVVED